LVFLSRKFETVDPVRDYSPVIILAPETCRNFFVCSKLSKIFSFKCLASCLMKGDVGARAGRIGIKLNIGEPTE